MSATGRTLMPPEKPQRMLELLGALGPEERPRPPALLGPDGTHIELPTEVFELLRGIVEALANGQAITVASLHTVLTTTEAADLIGVSRPTLVRLLETGEIPYEQPSRHRKVRLDDVLAYRERAQRARAAALDEMVRDAEDSGLYALPEDATAKRLSPDGNAEG